MSELDGIFGTRIERGIEVRLACSIVWQTSCMREKSEYTQSAVQIYYPELQHPGSQH